MEIRPFDNARIDTILSTDEVLKIRKADLENFILKNSWVIGRDLAFAGRRIIFPEGRVDLMFEDENENLVVVELEMNEVGRGALDQLRKYMHFFQKHTSKEVHGILVCKDILPAFADDFKKLRDIQVFCFAWKLLVRKRRKWD